jgi:anti-anti-sigma regulatory factor
MAANEENDLIGYDPLVWMEGDAEINADHCVKDKSDSDNEQEEQQLIDNEISMIDDYSDDFIGNAKQDAVLQVTGQDQPVIDESDDQNDGVLAEDCVAANAPGNLAELGRKSEGSETQGAVAEDLADASLIDLDATLTIQNVSKLHEMLKNSLAVYDQIEINASDVSSIDTATLQLLVALKKEAVKLQKQVTIIYPSPRFVESAQLLGLLDVLEVHDA